MERGILLRLTSSVVQRGGSDGEDLLQERSWIGRVHRGWVLASSVVAYMLLVAAPAFAVSGSEVAYVGGTSAGVPNGTIGTLDMVAVDALAFRLSGGATAGKIDIPYAKITNFQYSTGVAHHIGVLPAIAVGLVKKRERNTSSPSATSTHPMGRRWRSLRSRRMSRRRCLRSFEQELRRPAER
jgi:hypothetical protein